MARFDQGNLSSVPLYRRIFGFRNSSLGGGEEDHILVLSAARKSLSEAIFGDNLGKIVGSTKRSLAGLVFGDVAEYQEGDRGHLTIARRVEDLERDVKEIEEDISEMRSDINSLRSDINGLRFSLTFLEYRISSLESRT